MRRQAELGAIAMQPVLAQQTQLAQAQATVPALEKALGQTRHQLALLAGRLPGEDGLPEFTLESLHLPQELPLSLPSALVRQQPDIQASEALLHAASAQVGVATANLYPQITLSASAGFASLGLGNCSPGEQPGVDGGRRPARAALQRRRIERPEARRRGRLRSGARAIPADRARRLPQRRRRVAPRSATPSRCRPRSPPPTWRVNRWNS
ncbi:MAG: TolC family protein [Rhizobacter sp.]|nr:TolC family protein [Rhizobacter sp.]